MNTQFDHLSSQLAALCRQQHIRKLSLFGSAARGEMGPNSDVDLLVEFEQGYAPSLAGFGRLKNLFANVLEAPSIDLATPSILRNPYRRKAILADLKELYAARG